MNPVKITLESTFTPYTLDTYQTFDLSRETDYIIEKINEDHPDHDVKEQDVYFTFDNTGYLQALADTRLNLLKENILDNVILSIEVDGPPVSPREYNFTTDHAYNIFTVDQKALDKYIKDNQKDFEENKLKDGPGFMWLGDDDQTKLHYYLATESVKKHDNIESYYYDMVEAVSGCDYIEYITPFDRLEYLRAQLDQKNISTGELLELQSLKEYIQPGDVQLLEAAGVPEFEN